MSPRIPRGSVPFEVVSSNHDLWRIEHSFRMPETDLRSRLMFHRACDAIEAHVTIIFTALGVARYLRTHTGATLKAIVEPLLPMREVTITVGEQEVITEPQLTPDAQQILEAFLQAHQEQF